MRVLLCILLVLALSSPAFAGKPGVVELLDGSTVKGEIVSSGGGSYEIRTSSLGTLSIPESKIKSIRIGESAKATPVTRMPDKKTLAPSVLDEHDLSAVQERIQSDPGMMKIITSMQQDPELQDALRDPEFMNAINSRDITTLLANPKFRSLLTNPKLLEIQKMLTQ